MSNAGVWIAYVQDLGWEPPDDAVESLRDVLRKCRLLDGSEPTVLRTRSQIEASWALNWNEMDDVSESELAQTYDSLFSGRCWNLAIRLGPHAYVIDGGEFPIRVVSEPDTPSAPDSQCPFGFKTVFPLTDIASRIAVDVPRKPVRLRNPITGDWIDTEVYPYPADFPGWVRSHIAFDFGICPIPGERTIQIHDALEKATGTEWSSCLFTEH